MTKIDIWRCNFLQKDGGTALHVACQCGHLEVAQRLYSHGADIHIRMLVKNVSSSLRLF